MKTVFLVQNLCYKTNTHKKTPQGHRSCVRENSILCYLTARNGWASRVLLLQCGHVQSAKHALFGKIRLLLFFIWGVKRTIPHHPMSAKLSMTQCAVLHIREKRLHWPTGEPHFRVLHSDKPAHQLLIIFRPEAHSEKTADWESESRLCSWPNSLVWGQQDEGNLTGNLGSVISSIIKLPSEAMRQALHLPSALMS